MKTKTSSLPLTVLAFDNPTQASQLQEALMRIQSEQLARRVNLHLALGGSFEAATQPVASVTKK